KLNPYWLLWLSGCWAARCCAPPPCLVDGVASGSHLIRGLLIRVDMFGARIYCVRQSKRFFNFHYRRRFCTSTTQNNKQLSSNNSSNGDKNGGRISGIRDLEGYRDLDNLDFMKAAKILFSTPPKTKKFGR
ncbi:Intracellular protein transport protein USO1, partial [Bienertia sinuspersici]